MDRASVSVAVTLGMILSRVKPMTETLIFTAFPCLTFSIKRDSVEIQQQQQPSFIFLPLFIFFYDSTLKVGRWQLDSKTERSFRYLLPKATWQINKLNRNLNLSLAPSCTRCKRVKNSKPFQTYVISLNLQR